MGRYRAAAGRAESAIRAETVALVGRAQRNRGAALIAPDPGSATYRGGAPEQSGSTCTAYEVMALIRVPVNSMMSQPATAVTPLGPL